MIPKVYRRLLIIVYTSLFLITYASYIYNIIHFEDNWECVTCRGENSNIVQQFLYFSMWSLYLTTASFIGWAFFTPPRDDEPQNGISTSNDNDNNINANDNENGNGSGTIDSSASSPLTNKIFNISLPVSCTVLVSHLVYIISTPPGKFVDTDLCYRLGTIFVPKDNHENDTTVNFLLAIGFISDLTIHWFSAPLLLTLFYWEEVPFTGRMYYPWSTVLFVILAILIGLLQGPFDVTTFYCVDNVVMSFVSICTANWVIHTLFVCLVSGKCTCWFSRTTKTQSDDSIMEEEDPKSPDEDDALKEDLSPSRLVHTQHEKNQGHQQDNEEV